VQINQRIMKAQQTRGLNFNASCSLRVTHPLACCSSCPCWSQTLHLHQRVHQQSQPGALQEQVYTGVKTTANARVKERNELTITTEEIAVRICHSKCGADMSRLAAEESKDLVPLCSASGTPPASLTTVTPRGNAGCSVLNAAWPLTWDARAAVSTRT
jgi:hypothetical protein